MSEQYRISFNRENCIQCHGCEVACKNWRSVELGVKWRRVENIWKGSYPDVKSLSASIACMHCVEPPCMETCPEGAINKLEEGIVVVDRDKCIGCQTCLEVCPFGVPVFGKDEKMQKCDMCCDQIDFESEAPPCVKTCPTEALTFIKMDDKEKRVAEESMKKLIAMI